MAGEVAVAVAAATTKATPAAAATTALVALALHVFSVLLQGKVKMWGVSM